MSKKKQNKKLHNKKLLGKKILPTDKEELTALGKISSSGLAELRSIFESHPTLPMKLIQSAIIGRDIEVLELLLKNFGKIFKNHCKHLICSSPPTNYFIISSPKIIEWVNAKALDDNLTLTPNGTSMKLNLYREKQKEYFNKLLKKAEANPVKTIDINQIHQKASNLTDKFVFDTEFKPEDCLFIETENFLIKGIYGNNNQLLNLRKAVQSLKTIIEKYEKNNIWTFYYLISIYKICLEQDLKNYLIDQLIKVENWGILYDFYLELFAENLKNLSINEAVSYAAKAHTLILEGLILEDDRIALGYYNLALVIRDFRPQDAYHLLKAGQIHNPNDKRISTEIFELEKALAQKIYCTGEIITLDKNNLRSKAGNLVSEIGKLFKSNKEPKEMLVFVEKYLKKTPELEQAENIFLQYHLFLIYTENNKDKQATKALEKFIDILVNFPYEIESNSTIWKFFFDIISIYTHDSLENGNFNNLFAVLKKFNKNNPTALFEIVRNIIKATIVFSQDLKLYREPENKLDEKSKKLTDNQSSKGEETVNKLITNSNVEVVKKLPLEIPQDEAVILKKELELPRIQASLPGNEKTVKIAPNLGKDNLNERLLKENKKEVKEDKNPKLSYDDIELLIESNNTDLIDAPSWHKYFSLKKKIILSKGAETIENNTKLTQEWKIGKEIYTTREQESNQVTRVEKINYHYTPKNYYATIETNIAQDLEKLPLKLCQQALSKK